MSEGGDAMPLSGARPATRSETAGRPASPEDWSFNGGLYGTVLDSLAEEVAIANRDGEIIGCNKAWRAADTAHAMLGRRIDTGSDYLDALRHAAAEHSEAAAVLHGVERVLKGQSASFQYEYSCLWEGRERWFSVRVTPLQRHDGGIILIHDDITDKRLAERERDLQRAELNRAGRVAGLGEMSGAIAHELNQPLAAILANAQVGIDTAMRAGVNGELLAILKDIESDTKRASEVIKRVRSLLRHRESDFAPIDLNQVVTEVLSLIHSDSALRAVSVSTSLDGNLPLLRGDAIELQQLLLNLVMNACEAMTGTERGKRALHIATAVRAGGRIELSVSDTGKGFDGIGLERLVEPFFTTKEKGLGLGLTICGAIVQAHGGSMKLAARERGGALVSVEFPPPPVADVPDAHAAVRTAAAPSIERGTMRGH